MTSISVVSLPSVTAGSKCSQPFCSCTACSTLIARHRSRTSVRDRSHATSFFLYDELVGFDPKKRHCSFSHSRLQNQLIVSVKLPSAFALYRSVVGPGTESHHLAFGFQLE